EHKKFLIHTLLQSLSAKRTSWNEFSTAMASAETVAEDVANEAIPSTPTLLILPSPSSHDIPSTSQVQSSHPQQPQSSPQALPHGVEFPTHLFQQVLDTCSALTRRVENLEHDKAAQKLEIIKLKTRVTRLERANKGRMIDDLDKDEGIELVVDQVVTAATSQVSTASATIFAVKPSIPAAAPTVVAAYTKRRKGDKGKGILIETPNPIKKKDQIELDAEYARKLHEEINKDHEEINKDIDWDAAIDHVKKIQRESLDIKKYQVMKKIPQTESEARKNMMIYLKNTAG
nr:hypothetical protein [Tanacetum cinerariifolium]